MRLNVHLTRVCCAPWRFREAQARRFFFLDRLNVSGASRRYYGVVDGRWRDYAPHAELQEFVRHVAVELAVFGRGEAQQAEIRRLAAKALARPGDAVAE